MRKLIAFTLAAFMVALGLPVAAQAPPSNQAAVSGHVVDAAGRGVSGQRVELVQQGVVLQTTMTTARGAYAFSSVPAGDYVVRVSVNNVPAGIRVALTSGAPFAGANIVLPSVAAPSGALLGPLLLPVIIGGVGLAVGVGLVIKNSGS